MRDKFDGLDGAVVSSVKVEVQYMHDPSVKHVFRFADHNSLNNWLMSKHVRGRLRVTQLLIRYDYED